MDVAVINGLIKVGKDAFDVIGAFRGDDPTGDDKVQQAIEVLQAVFPLVEDFANGQEITEQDAQTALDEWSDHLDELQAEIARQRAGG